MVVDLPMWVITRRAVYCFFEVLFFEIKKRIRTNLLCKIVLKNAILQAVIAKMILDANCFLLYIYFNFYML